MQIGISLNFKTQTTDGKYYLRLFQEYVRFEPKLILVKTFGGKWKQYNWKPEKHLKIIEQCDENTCIIVGFNGGGEFNSSDTFSDAPHRSISITQSDKNIDLKEIDLGGDIKKTGFVSAYVYDADYEKVQSTKFANNLDGLGMSDEILSTIENTPYEIEHPTGFKIYDISHNPGRSELIGYTWLMPAWKMWFGPGFYHLVPKDRIVAFPDAFEINELEDDIIYVNLFEKAEDSWRKENMEKQWAWRNWLDFERLVEQYP